MRATQVAAKTRTTVAAVKMELTETAMLMITLNMIAARTICRTAANDRRRKSSDKDK